MKEHEPITTFFDALFEGIGGARKVVRAVSEKAEDHSKGVVHEALIYLYCNQNTSKNI